MCACKDQQTNDTLLFELVAASTGGDSLAHPKKDLTEAIIIYTISDPANQLEKVTRDLFRCSAAPLPSLAFAFEKERIQRLDGMTCARRRWYQKHTQIAHAAFSVSNMYIRAPLIIKISCQSLPFATLIHRRSELSLDHFKTKISNCKIDVSNPMLCLVCARACVCVWVWNIWIDACTVKTILFLATVYFVRKKAFQCAAPSSPSVSCKE